MSDTSRKGVDMTTGAIAPGLLTLAWPLVLGNLLQTFYNLADIFWLGRVSSAAVAGVALMFPLAWMFISTAIGITAATIALVSQFVGANRQRHADRVVAQSMLLATLASIILGILGWIFRHHILSLMGAEGAVFVEALAYIEIIFVSLPFMFLFFAFRASLQGAGDTKTAMWLVLVSAGLNVVIDPFLILGWGPFPAMGTRGAAWATFISRGVATGLGILILLDGTYGVKLYVGDLLPHRPTLVTLINVGYPGTLDGWARSSAAVVMAALVTPFGEAVIAAYGIGVRLMSISWTISGALGDATATGVGQNLGAETPDRAATVTHVGTATTMILLFLAGGISIAFPEYMIGIFIDDPAVIQEGVTFLWIIAPFWAFFGGTMVIQGAFRGAGRTGVSMALSLLSRWVFRIPVALGLAFSANVVIPGIRFKFDDVGFGIGVEGIWAAFSFGAFLTFVLAIGWFRLGTWQQTVISESEEREHAP